MNEPVAGNDMQVVTLIPNESFILVRGADPLDTTIIQEMRVHAYLRRNKPTLGAGQVGEVLLTLAEIAASGILGNAAYDQLKQTRRYLEKWRTRSRPELGGADTAADIVRTAAPRFLNGEPSSFTVSHARRTQTGCWEVVAVADAQRLHATMDPSGAITSIEVSD